VVSGKLEEPVNVAELVLVNDGVLAEVDMVHCLRQIHEGPALKTYIFRGLQLVV
jgi:sulfur transfer complex TusBCD TusB component (DsrH family)